ncbi:putative flavin-binding monooxygenase-like family protein [Neofusicoccum parvum]|uniref:Flavin-binding monooxygenase-like family protein n=1 Tax=Neofusicoccum parvum TaxID=310453 RepID=A0ACB5RN46_9PEZI|nr:putative flavin-binding monooxygenase-like family protein [Neofusicoccum parvum]
MAGSISLEASQAGPDPKVLQKYEEERQKRVREDGQSQFIDLDKTDRFKYLGDDPWVDHDALNAQEPPLSDGSQCQFLIYGAGFGGLCYAVRLIEAGFCVEDICIVDTAGGFGGTWYWNRYPGLMCDVESYIYLPLLEETGFMPKHKYSYGPEIRGHAERIASKWNLKALFRTQVKSQTWDESRKQWAVNMTEGQGPGQEARDLQVHSNFVVIAGGILNVPHIPKLAGLEDFKGQHFHSSRWDYKITGGSEHDQQLTELKGKRVGFIGTGATAVQAVPVLAKYAKELYVFQRTPSACDTRGQRETTPEDWKKIAYRPGWQRERRENFNSFIFGNPEGTENLVNDGWTTFPSYQVVLGGPLLAPSDIPAHIDRMNALDFPRSERVRARVDALVKDPATAASLKAYYPGWCKRPTYHDEFLQTFNAPHVHLIDTAGAGISHLTPTSVVANNTAHPIDILILGTGYRPPMPGSWALNAGGVKVTGRDGLDMDGKWAAVGAATLHGVAAHGFPNLLLWSPTQTGMTANAVAVADDVARHAAYVVREARRRAGGVDAFALQPSRAAEEAWATESAARAAWFAPLFGCTPSYLNMEGDAERRMAAGGEDERAKAGRAAHWAGGAAEYNARIKAWRDEGGMQGIEIWT